MIPLRLEEHEAVRPEPFQQRQVVPLDHVVCDEVATNLCVCGVHAENTGARRAIDMNVLHERVAGEPYGITVVAHTARVRDRGTRAGWRPRRHRRP